MATGPPKAVRLKGEVIVRLRRQLGIAHDPLSLRSRLATIFNHPLTVGHAVIRQLSRR